MPPAVARRFEEQGIIFRVAVVFLRRVHGIIDEHVCVFGDFQDIDIQFAVAVMLGVGRIRHDFPARFATFQTVRQNAVRMIQVLGNNGIAADSERGFLQFVKMDIRAHAVEADGEILIFHLPAQRVFKAFEDFFRAVQIEGVRSIRDAALLLIFRADKGRHEKWKALNMIPMRMAEKNMPFAPAAPESVFHQFHAQLTNAGARIEDNQRAVISLYRNA